MPVSSSRTKQKSRRASSAQRRGRTPKAHVVIDDRSGRGRGRTRSRATSTADRVRKDGKDYVVLPSWKELDKATNGRVVIPGSHPFDSISTARIALLILVVAVAVTGYVGHVHATQGVLQSLEELRMEGAALRLEYNSVKGEYDRLTGPAAIRKQARELGLSETTTYGQPIMVKTGT
jgi:cell division protein FtsL